MKPLSAEKPQENSKSPQIRPARRSDLPGLMEIERNSFSYAHWPPEGFLHYDCIVAEIEQKIVGFLVSRQTFPGNAQAPPEREILNLAVAPDFRRMGIATRLLRHELARGGVHFLEVRESNRPAQALYRKIGFIPVGRRPGYYQNPPETAIVMRMK